MSFQDFSRSGRNYTPSGGAAGTSSQQSQQQAPSSGGSASSKDAVLSQISEAILQYQRNVGILEKIVHSLTARSKNSAYASFSTHNTEELTMQYKAQVDVIGQLEDKVRRLILKQQSNKDQQQQQQHSAAALIKLERDFERVQARAKALQQGVARIQKDMEKQTTSNRSGVSSQQQQGDSSSSSLDHYQQIQMQLQQDRLNEEIMREREEEIRNINRGMHQVNEIYKDLAHIVGSQQEQIDTIETQMEDSRENAQAGLQQVEKANEKFGSSQCTIS